MGRAAVLFVPHKRSVSEQWRDQRGPPGHVARLTLPLLHNCKRSSAQLVLLLLERDATLAG